MSKDQIILNLGCGHSKSDNEYGIDIINTPSVDIVANLGKKYLPIKSSSVDKIVSNHFLEHVSDTVSAMEEIHRILKPDGIAHIKVPHVSNIGFYKDPTHMRPFTYDTFDFFVKNKKPVEYTKINFEYIKKELIFSKGLRGKIGYFLFKLSPRSYEKYYTWKYPCYEIEVILRAIK